MKNTIILYTGSYPYGQTTESFVGPELEIVNSLKEYDVRILPVVKDRPLRNLPKNIKLDNAICDASLLYKIKAFLLIFTPFSLSLMLKDRKEVTCFRFFCQMIKYLYASNLVYLDVRKRANTSLPITFYSFWMSYVPIAFGRFRTKVPTTPHHFVTRGHGGDVYTVDRGRFYPFRDFVLKNIDHVYVVSKYGRDYLRNKYPLYKDKIESAYLGVMPLKVTNVKSKRFKVVSCSSVYDFKRVDLLFLSLEKFALSHPGCQIEWTHFGGGYLFKKLNADVESNQHASNLRVILKGRCNNEDVLNHYRENGYNVFIHLSTTEGLPVSMMEALSASIPIIATAVGGVPEIVTEKTGILLNVDFNQYDFDLALEKVISNHESMAVSAKEFFDENFNAINNYRNFYISITKQ